MTKEQLQNELESIQKSHSKISLEKDKILSIAKKQKTELTTKCNENNSLTTELTFIKEKLNEYDIKCNELKMNNIQLMKIIENMTTNSNNNS